MPDLSKYSELTQNILSIYGVSGEEWLIELPARLKYLSKQYDLTDLTLLEPLSYNVVYRGMRKGTPIILKVGPDREGLARESKALNHFQDYGVPILYDAGDGFLLLENIDPGTSLMTTFPDQDQMALDILCDLASRLHQSPKPFFGDFPDLKQWLEVLDNPWDIPDEYLSKVRILYKELLATTPESILLHGDLHHYNMLLGKNGWVAIDPKGVIGDPLFEYCAFIRNPHSYLINHSSADKIILSRLDYLSTKLQTSQQRLLNWCFVESVLSWVWNLEDHLDVSSVIKLTEIYYSLMEKDK